MARKYLVALIILLAAWPAWGQESRPGIAVDSKGGQVIDPTKNVLDLVEAAIRRQDDLRALLRELFDAKLSAANELAELRQRLSDGGFDFGAGVREPRKPRPDRPGERTVPDSEDRSVKGRTL